MKTLKPAILTMNEYVVAQHLDLIKLNQNESSEDIPSFLKQQILERMASVSWNRYPPDDARTLIPAIAAYAGVPPSKIMVGNGSNELIQTLIHSTCDSGQRIMTVQPSFSVYKRVAEVMNIQVTEVPLDDNYGFDTEALIENGQDVQIMFLAVPNSPTGTILDVDQIRRIAECVPCVVAVDEAYYEFYGETVLPLVSNHDNIVILRTFSKALRLAGLRLGYLLGPVSLIKGFKKVKLPFSVGFFQQIAGEIMLKNKDIWLDSSKQVIQEKNRVFIELEKMEEIDAIPSHANFILFGIRGLRAKDVFKELISAGVLVRCFDSERLEKMLRVTIGTPEENDAFLLNLRDVIGRRRDEDGTL